MSSSPVKHYRIAFDRKALESFCMKNGIRKLAFFGSVLRDNFGPDSDIDLLVEFLPGEVIGFFRIYDMEEELSLLFGGRKVDLRTPPDLSRYFRERVISEAEVLFER